MMDYILIVILIAFAIYLLFILFYTIKEKKTLTNERKKGIIDHYILLNNCENVIRKIINERKKDPHFSDEMEKIYLKEINNFIESANISLDYSLHHHISRSITSTNVFELLLLAEIIKHSQLSKGMVMKGTLPFKITPKEIKFEDVQYEPITFLNATN